MSIFGSSESPKVYEPATMPSEDDEAILAAKRKKAAQVQSRSGRSSTILTDQTDKLGG